ncbi:hypothetical protein ACFVIN_16495 [Streptomyces prasinus]|uniref:hypothetical protein n=1 Tax=Streptomyces prasinus TaxID=67345 RepID=UPI003631EE17
MADLRPIGVPFDAPGPTGVAIRDRLGHLTTEDEQVLRLIGAHLGSLGREVQPTHRR